MSNRRPIYFAAFAILLLVAFAVWLASLSLHGRPDDALPAKAGEHIVASLPAVAAAESGKSSERAEASSGAATAAPNTELRDGVVIVTDGGPIPAGTRATVRLDNPDFLSTLSFKDFMKFGPGGGPSQMRRMTKEIRARKKVGASAAVAADGKFRIEAPTDGDFFIDIDADSVFADRYPRFSAADHSTLGVRARRGVALRGKVTSPEGKPIGGAKVLFVPLEIPMPPSGSFTPREMRTVAAADGTFILRGVPAQMPGNILALQSGYAVGVLAVRSSDAAQTENVVRLAPAGRVIGRVVDDRFAPVANAKIEISGTSLTAIIADIEQREASLSDASGAFELLDVAPGRMRIHTDKPGLRPGDSIEMDVHAGAIHDAGTIVMKRGFSIEGTLVDPDDKAVPGAKVTLAFSATGNPMETGQGGAAMTDAVEVVTDKDGNFSMVGLGKGPYDLEARVEGFAPARKNRYMVDDKPVKLRLRRSGIVEGDVVRTTDGSTIDEFDVEAQITTILGQGFPVNDKVAEQHVRAGQAGKGGEPAQPSGRFRFDGLAPGTYSIIVRAKGFAPAAVANIAVKAAEPAKVSAALEPGAAIAGVVLERSTKRPLPGASVVRSSNLMDMFDKSLPRTTSDGDGRFRLDDLKSGEFSIVVSYGDFAPERVNVGKIGPGEKREDLEITLGSGGSIEGIAYSEEGVAMANGIATATSIQVGHMSQAMLDAQGRFEIHHLPAGAYQVNVLRGSMFADAAASGGADMLRGMRVAEAKVADGETTNITIGEETGKIVRARGKVLSRGEPMGGAFISILSTPAPGAPKAGASSTRFTTTDDKGKFEVRLPPGTTTFNVQRAGRAEASVEFERTIPDSASCEVETLEMPVGSISGVVKDERGQPAAGVPVRISIESASARSTFGGLGIIRTNEEGRYNFDQVRDGVYSVSAGGNFLFSTGDSALGIATQRIEVAGGAPQNADFVLAPGGTISGRVTSRGNPVAGASIFLQTADGKSISRLSDVFSDGNGSYRASSVGRGSYRVIVRALNLAQKTIEGIVVESGRTATCDVELDPGTQLTVRVTDSDGAPIPASVEVYDESGRRISGYTGVLEITAAVTEGAPPPGEVRLGTLKQGPYRIVARCAGFKGMERTIDLSGDAPRVETVALEKG